MTEDEKLTLVFGYLSTDFPPMNFTMPEGARERSAGFVSLNLQYVREG